MQALPNKLALIVNHENITNNWYVGNDRSMLVCNCLFRLGGAGALLSNRPKDLRRAKYELMHTVRVHLGCEDDAFGCMGNGEDSEGIKGVFLRRNVVNVAGRALKVNLQRLGPLVLPFTEMVRPPLLLCVFAAAIHTFLKFAAGEMLSCRYMAHLFVWTMYQGM